MSLDPAASDWAGARLHRRFAIPLLQPRNTFELRNVVRKEGQTPTGQSPARGLVGAGVDGLLLLGTAGEGPVLPSPLWTRALAVAVAAADERVPSVVCVSGQTTDTVLRRIDEAVVAGASAVLVLPPFYYPLSQRHLHAFVDRIAARSDLPVILYHIPSLTGHGFEIELLSEWATHPRVIGVKDSGRDRTFHERLLREIGSRSLEV
jgi:4-hydroxy-tetrahydrodipicolinate synthase